MRAFNYDGASLAGIAKVTFFAYGTLKYGANGAGGDVDGDGFGEILTGPGPSAVFGPQLRGFNYDNVKLESASKINAFVFSSGSYGLTVAAGDIDADRHDDIAGGRGPGPAEPADVAMLDFSSGTLLPLPGGTATAFAGSVGGMHCALGDLGGDRRVELLLGSGSLPATVPRVRAYLYSGGLQAVAGTDFQPENVVVRYGVGVALGRLDP